MRRVLNKQCTLTAVVQCTKRLRVHTSTLKAVAGKGDVTTVVMVSSRTAAESGPAWLEWLPVGLGREAESLIAHKGAWHFNDWWRV